MDMRYLKYNNCRSSEVRENRKTINKWRIREILEIFAFENMEEKSKEMKSVVKTDEEFYILISCVEAILKTKNHFPKSSIQELIDKIHISDEGIISTIGDELYINDDIATITIDNGDVMKINVDKVIIVNYKYNYDTIIVNDNGKILELPEYLFRNQNKKLLENTSNLK